MIMDMASVKEQSGVISLVAIAAWIVISLMGIIPQNTLVIDELSRIAAAVSELEDSSEQQLRDRDERIAANHRALEERVSASESVVLRLGLGVENNREFITNTASTLNGINAALSDIRIEMVKVAGRLSEIDRRTGGKADEP
jgi:hypothetical protein